VNRAPAAAKINLALVVGPRREDGLHEVATVLQRVALCDRIAVAPAPRLHVTGFPGDTLVRRALELLAERAGIRPAWHATISKRIPVAAGLGGGSSDAATALRLANALLPEPLDDLHEPAAALGSDVPFFLTAGPQLAEGTGTTLRPLTLRADYWIVLVAPHGEAKSSTADVYRAFDERSGEKGFAERRAALLERVEAQELAGFPPNDLASSPVAARLRELGAFRADVSGAGPAVYGLFRERDAAVAAQRRLRRAGRTWLTVPAWYG
jgi:4-diphosphocytidyl-2-C-methyl-D-erythritol kinase